MKWLLTNDIYLLKKQVYNIIIKPITVFIDNDYVDKYWMALLYFMIIKLLIQSICISESPSLNKQYVLL